MNRPQLSPIERPSPSRLRPRLSLKARTLLTIAVLMAAIAGTVDLMELRHGHAERIRLLEGRAQALTSIIADALVQPLWNSLEEQVADTLAAAMHDPDFEAIEVRDIGDRVLAAQRMPGRSIDPVEMHGELVHVEKGARYVLGYLVVRLSKTGAEAVYYKQIRDSLIKFVLILAVTMVSIYAALRLITDPLERMTRIMTRVAEGESGLDIPATDRRDEIGAMARAVEVFKRNAAEVQRLSIERERFRAQETEQVLRRRFEQAIDSVAQAIALFDADQRLVDCNTAWLDLHRDRNGVRPPRGALVGQSYQALLSLRTDNGLYDVRGDGRSGVIADRLAWSACSRPDERTFRLADDRWMHMVRRTTPDGGSIYVVTDVTNIKAAETRRLELETQLHHSQRLEALGTLAGGIAHDLNNTLVPILGLTRLAAESVPADSRARKSLLMIAEAGMRAKRLVNQILAFSRKEQRELKQFDLAQLVREAIALLRSAIPATIRIELDLGDVPPLAGDDGQLHQVIVNLITNASHAIGRGPGLISVSLGTELLSDGTAAAFLAVTDTGCGMDEATRQRVFEPFFSTKPVNEGTGLGLSVVHGIVTAHGGSITVASQPNQGSTFRMVLPIAQPNPAAPSDLAAA